MNNDISITELYVFIKKLREYEPGLVKIIQEQCVPNYYIVPMYITNHPYSKDHCGYVDVDDDANYPCCYFTKPKLEYNYIKFSVISCYDIELDNTLECIKNIYKCHCMDYKEGKCDNRHGKLYMSILKPYKITYNKVINVSKNSANDDRVIDLKLEFRDLNDIKDIYIVGDTEFIEEYYSSEYYSSWSDRTTIMHNCEILTDKELNERKNTIGYVNYKKRYENDSYIMDEYKNISKVPSHNGELDIDYIVNDDGDDDNIYKKRPMNSGKHCIIEKISWEIIIKYIELLESIGPLYDECKKSKPCKECILGTSPIYSYYNIPCTKFYSKEGKDNISICTKNINKRFIEDNSSLLKKIKYIDINPVPLLNDCTFKESCFQIFDDKPYGVDIDYYVDD